MYNTLIKSLVSGPQTRHQNWKFASVAALKKLTISLSHYFSCYRLSKAALSVRSQLRRHPLGLLQVCPQVRAGGQAGSEQRAFSLSISAESSFVGTAMFSWTKVPVPLGTGVSAAARAGPSRRLWQGRSADCAFRLRKAQCVKQHAAFRIHVLTVRSTSESTMI